MDWNNYFNGNDYEELEGNFVLFRKQPKRRWWLLLILLLLLLIILYPPKNTQNKAHTRTKAVNSVNIPTIPKTAEKQPKNVQKSIGYDYKRLTEAIMRYETGHFKSNAWLNKNNACGIMTWENGKRELKRFASQEAGKEACYDLVKKYFDRGQNTPEKMQPNYCPSNEGGKNWIRSVKLIYGGLK